MKQCLNPVQKVTPSNSAENRWPVRKIGLAFCAILMLLSWGQAGLIHAKAVLAQQLILSSWQASLSQGQVQKPWPWADTWPMARLQFGDEDQIALAGADGSSLAFGPGLLYESAEPNSGSVAIAGHRDTHFRALEQLQIGDTLRLQNRSGVWFRYQIGGIAVVNSDESALVLNHQLRQLTLITCYPFDAITPGGSLRYVVTAALMNVDPGDKITAI